MTYALRAAVLITVQSVVGTWCSLNWIVSRVIRPKAEVEQICDDLVNAGELQANDLGGARSYGIGCQIVTGAPPAIAEQWPQPPGERDGVPVLRLPPMHAELMAWHDAEAGKPDADILHLLWIADEDGHCDWDSGWWSGEAWLFAESGGNVAGRVLFYASPKGPVR